MDKFKHIDDAIYIFGVLPVIANKMDTLIDRALKKHNVTAKQWFLLLVLFNAFDSPPTIKEVAKEMGSSHQNVKQVALKLKEKGMLLLEKDKNDMRATRLIPTEKSFEFWQNSDQDGRDFLKAFYQGIEPSDISRARPFINKLLENLDNMEGEKENE